MGDRERANVCNEHTCKSRYSFDLGIFQSSHYHKKQVLVAQVHWPFQLAAVNIY